MASSTAEEAWFSAVSPLTPGWGLELLLLLLLLLLLVVVLLTPSSSFSSTSASWADARAVAAVAVGVGVSAIVVVRCAYSRRSRSLCRRYARCARCQSRGFRGAE